jgi:hypothetical protein
MIVVSIVPLALVIVVLATPVDALLVSLVVAVIAAWVLM